ELPLNFFYKITRFVDYDLTRRKKLWTCSTNNYAVVKNENLLPLLRSHIAASGYFDSEKEKVKRIDGHLSIMNRTLASQTSLGWKKPGITKRELIRKFHKYKKMYSEIEIPELEWCRPYINMMKD